MELAQEEEEEARCAAYLGGGGAIFGVVVGEAAEGRARANDDDQKQLLRRGGGSRSCRRFRNFHESCRRNVWLKKACNYSTLQFFRGLFKLSCVKVWESLKLVFGSEKRR